jgi:hypothetical protein
MSILKTSKHNKGYVVNGQSDLIMERAQAFTLYSKGYFDWDKMGKPGSFPHSADLAK